VDKYLILKSQTFRQLSYFWG